MINNHHAIFYYRGRELEKRLAERMKEVESDNRDRFKENEEIEELKNKIFSGEYEDPSAEFERVSLLKMCSHNFIYALFSAGEKRT